MGNQGILMSDCKNKHLVGAYMLTESSTVGTGRFKNGTDRISYENLSDSRETRFSYWETQLLSHEKQDETGNLLLSGTVMEDSLYSVLSTTTITCQFLHVAFTKNRIINKSFSCQKFSN